MKKGILLSGVTGKAGLLRLCIRTPGEPRPGTAVFLTAHQRTQPAWNQPAGRGLWRPTLVFTGSPTP